MQITLAQVSLFMYAALPVLSEWLIEEGYTKVDKAESKQHPTPNPLLPEASGPSEP